VSVRIGLMLVPEADPADVVRTAQTAEDQGFDFLACGEHVFFHAPTPNAFLCLAAAAAATTRIRLLSALTLVPMYPAGLFAKMVATLDRLSGGRFDLGVGLGGEYPPELASCGVQVTERGPRTDETLELSRRLFAGETVPHEGRFADFVDLALRPLPIQHGGPPVWVGGRRAAATRRAGRLGDHWLPYMVSPEQLDAGLRDVRATAVAHGRGAEDVHGAIYAWSAVDRDAGAARAGALRALGSLYQQDFSAMADRYVPTGTPEQVTEKLLDYVHAGAESVLISPACEPEQRAAMVDLFAAEVVPALRQAATARTAATNGVEETA